MAYAICGAAFEMGSLGPGACGMETGEPGYLPVLVTQASKPRGRLGY